MNELVRALNNTNVQAFLHVIRAGESSHTEAAYRMMFGGGLFVDTSKHPNVKVTRGQLTSTAAGAYQFLHSTWLECQKALGLPDFGEASQDLAAVYLIKRRGALEDVMAGRLSEAIKKCNREWASLPGSPYGQPTRTYAQAEATYTEYGGSLATSSKHDQETSGSVTYPAGEAASERPMAPFIAAVLPSIIGAVPKLIEMFGSGSEVSKRNEKAAEVVVAVAKEALGAVNEQEVASRLATDPQAPAIVRKAVEARWFDVQKVIDQSTTEARQFVDSYSRIKDVRTVWLNMTFVELLTAFLAISGVLGGLAVLKWGDVGQDLKGAIITLILIESVVGVRKFWLGNTQPPASGATKE